MNTTLVPTPGTAAERSRAIREVYEPTRSRFTSLHISSWATARTPRTLHPRSSLKAAVALDTSQDPRSMLAWLYQVARTSVSDYWRRYYKTLTSSLDAMEEDSLSNLVASRYAWEAYRRMICSGMCRG